MSSIARKFQWAYVRRALGRFCARAVAVRREITFPEHGVGVSAMRATEWAESCRAEVRD